MKLYNKIKYKVYILLNQRKYKNGSSKIKYIFEQSNETSELVIIFNAFPGKNKRARYNYIRTLETYNINKLFILDDFGPNGSGSYFLGENKKKYIEKTVLELIETIKGKCDSSNITCIGSSKGGYCALYFGLKINAVNIICGAPQYFLGNYLVEKETHEKIFKYIMGEVTDRNIEYLNELLKNCIYESNNNTNIYIHYSKNENTYKKHIKNMIEDFKENGYHLASNVEDYENHSDVEKYFPQFIKVTLEHILNKGENRK